MSFALDPERLRARAAILRAMRGWFDEHGYLEVHTPALVPSPALEENLEAVRVGELFLHTSPEFAMKRVFASGLCRVYQMGPCFREEEAGAHHAREFTLLEWYRAGAGLQDLMDEVEELIGRAAQALGQEPPRFARRAVSSLLADGGDPDAWFHAWVDRVEPTLREPTIVHGYPAWQAALARLRGDVAERFEVYLRGLELANAFHEELDPDVLRARWERSAQSRRARGREPHPLDERLLEAVARMPRCSGIALGVDRLVMALTGAVHIRQVQAG